MSRLFIKDERGSALIITLLIVSLLVGLVVDFVYETYIDSASLSNWSNAQKASFISKSGQTISANYLKLLKNLTPSTTRELVLPSFIDFGPGSHLYVKVEDESSKFNINSIRYQKGTIKTETFELLQKMFEYLNINPDVALAIADWLDKDIEPRLPNSENTSKNTFLWSLDELKLIDGIDDETFNKISPYLKVYGDDKININTAEIPVIISLHKDMTKTHAEKIIKHRKSTPFTGPGQVQNLPGLNAIGQEILSKIRVRGNTFRITAIATVNEINRVIETIMDTSMNIYFWRET